MYLVEPASGGHTRFPTLNISIPPRRGTALLWANVRDADPSRADPRTDHEAMPPTDGSVKVATNLWLHQYDFRYPNRRGCDMDRSVT